MKVYNFEVADWHTYYVSKYSVLVHNTGTNPCADGAGNLIKSGNNYVDDILNGLKETTRSKGVARQGSDTAVATLEIIISKSKIFKVRY